MKAENRDLIRQTLCRLVESQSATIELFEQTLSLLSDELALDPVSFWRRRPAETPPDASSDRPTFDRELLTITFRGRTRFLGSTLCFRLLERLALRPNAYLTYEELFTDVWEGVRSDSAVRAAIKRLRQNLRRLEMPELAEAIDGSVPGHYALKLAR